MDNDGMSMDGSAFLAFLRARLDEDEAACRAARKDGGGCWELIADERGDGAIYDDMGNPVVTYDTDPKTGVATRHDLNPLGARQAAHIVRHDPDRVLADVTADRRLIAEYEDGEESLSRRAAPDQRDIGVSEGLLVAVQLRAARFSEHEDYDASWRVEW